MAMRRWVSLPLTLLFALGLALPVWANSELHPGARLFYPLWDVSTPNRLTFIVVSREALDDGTSINAVGAGNQKVWTVSSTVNCIPRGADGSTSDVNRTDLGGTPDTPVFVDDLHIEYYGRSCSSANEVVHMSCGDVDLFLLSSSAPRFAFQSVAGDGRGALDAHLINNGSGGPLDRKLPSSFTKTYFNALGVTVDEAQNDNSLMGHAIISDVAEGWAATYPAAAAKSTTCDDCGDVDGGTFVGYENYPMEVFIPFALAENFPTQGGGALRNLLSLWGPGLFPGADLNNTSINLDFKWWDGRERAFGGSVNRHALIATLGGPQIAGQDAPVDPSRFNISNFTCGHASNTGQAENDGFPRSGSNSTACGAPSSADTAHPSDNAESGGDGSQPGNSIQSSTPIAWWRFRLRPDNQPPIELPAVINHSGRGLVGVVLSSTSTAGTGVGDVTRLWHKDPCEIAQSGFTWGPMHVRDVASLSTFFNQGGSTAGDWVALFNIFNFEAQALICSGTAPSPLPPGF
jgi:hypothetical protein